MTEQSGSNVPKCCPGNIPKLEDHNWGLRTRAIHAGNRPDPVTGARAVPICQGAFVFENAADAADLTALQKLGIIYTRIANPTVAAFEERLARLEGGIGAIAASSGQAAEMLLFTALAGAGSHRGESGPQRRRLHLAPRITEAPRHREPVRGKERDSAGEDVERVRAETGVEQEALISRIRAL